MENIQAIQFPIYKWKVTPIKGWDVNLETRPCLYNRFWYWLIFGWKFEKIEEIKKEEY